MAADRTRRFVAALHTTSDEAMELLIDDTRDPVQVYPTRPLPEILGHLVSRRMRCSRCSSGRRGPSTIVDCTFTRPAPGGMLSKTSHDLAITHVARGQVEVLAPVLDLPPERRINGIVHSVNRVHRAMAGADSNVGRELQESIEEYTRTPLHALPR